MSGPIKSTPPPVRHSSVMLDPKLNEAKEAALAEPGEWFQIEGLWGASLTSQINSGEHGVFGIGFESTARTALDAEPGSKRTKNVWVRYILGDEATATE